MSTTEAPGAAPAAAPPAPRPAPVRVSVPKHSIASELRAIRIMWKRDLVRFVNDRIRIAASLAQPLLFLFVMGSGLQLLLAFTITAFGVMVAARIKQMQSFFGVMQMVVMPMFFISGALFPASGLPRWLEILNRIDPLTYAVDPMRRLVFNHLTISPAARRALDPGVTWWGWHVPALLEAGVVALLGLLMLAIAIWEFSTSE